MSCTMSDASKDNSAAPLEVSVAACGEIVSVTVGPEKQIVNLHKTLICYHSEYFRTAFNGLWKESDEGVMIADVDIETFRLFVGGRPGLLKGLLEVLRKVSKQEDTPRELDMWSC
ncbi:hypothetical protein EJ02DRAFT_431095 [Clathrospora elynae]|uniref:BTB domain-containing protein n=1 Tax=Clathrospora elynae TaxID=706981 RepID=A0A6A5T0V9_9PLEO|nr:hypothetical protein EJ02DRAFT_431095 [Clathrospora elynae]